MKFQSKALNNRLICNKIPYTVCFTVKIIRGSAVGAGDAASSLINFFLGKIG